MDRLDEYCALLGVRPGASAEDVKRAFRTQIKQYHPDTASGGGPVSETALLLIEAYQALREGAPPPRFKDTAQGQEYFRRRREEAFRAREVNRRARQQSTVQQAARAAGRRLYEQMYGAPDSPPGEEAERTVFWERLSEMVFGVEAGSRYYGENIEVHEIHPGVRAQARVRRGARHPASPHAEPLRQASTVHEPLPGSFDHGRRFFDRAEALLRQVVERYDVPASLSRRDWRREYMAGLNNCQILFRDVAVRHPGFAQAALCRVRQIQELRTELRQMI